jgi:RNA polymerase sigma-70 factor (ECF subfamily)
MPLDAIQLAELIETQAVSLRLWVRSRCTSCEDVVQEAFCRLACQEPPPQKPVAWLYRVCRNLAETQRLSEERRRKREQARARPEIAPVAAVDSVELGELLAAVEELEDQLREVLVARTWGQLSLEEIGKLCGVSTATAFRRYEAALKTLRTRLESKCEPRP